MLFHNMDLTESRLVLSVWDSSPGNRGLPFSVWLRVIIKIYQCTPDIITVSRGIFAHQMGIAHLRDCNSGSLPRRKNRVSALIPNGGAERVKCDQLTSLITRLLF